MIDFVQVNLLPAEYRVHKRGLKIESEVVVPMIVVGAMAFGLVLYQGMLNARVMTLQNEIRALDAQIRLNAPIEDEIRRLSDEKKVIVGKIMALERISVNRGKWVRLMEALCRYLPEYSWLVSMKEAAGSPPTLVVQGKTRSFPEVATYMADLRQSVYMTSVELTKIEQVDEAEKIYGFEIVCTIDPNAGLTVETESAAPAAR
jgi:Tfp pilus assembly protein PilN